MGLLDALFGRKPRQLPETAKPLDEASWWRVLNLVVRLFQHKDEDPVALVTLVIGCRFKGKGLLPLALLAKQLMDRANTPGLHAAQLAPSLYVLRLHTPERAAHSLRFVKAQLAQLNKRFHSCNNLSIFSRFFLN
jgi:hypothetical protein